MEPKEFEIELPRGDTCPIFFELTDNEGNELNSKDFEIYFTLKKNFNKEEFLLQKRYSRGEITVDGKNVNLILSHQDTANMKYGKYNFDIQFSSGDYVKTILIGSIKLTKECTFLKNE